MIVNSTKEYRTWFKTQEDRPEVDENFMGCSYDTGTGKKKGFFNLFHGKKDDIERYLPSLLDIAEDNQAIYEFLQNAVDCGATHFWAFYNDNYFLAVNNGSKFTLDGISSILNIAQSTKTTASSIGRLGIGFKLAHRLVGKGNGTYELIHENKGPIMFSWDNASQLRSLMSTEDIHYEGLDQNPFLLKIAITNFPANIGECVKDVDYHNVVVFPESELSELRNYTKQCLESLFLNNSCDFNQGTLFFIKLGENKRELLDADLATLKNGIEYSMNTLRQLNNICFNGETIAKKQLVVNDTSIAKTTDLFTQIDPQYKEYDILYSFGFLPLDFSNKEYYQGVEQLRQSPNFYKYFPMGDEVDNMALFVHSDSFQIEANRRKLTNHHTNRELLPEIATYIIDTLNKYKLTDRTKFLQLYASILLTDKPASQEKTWMHSVFFDKLYPVLKTCIPTEKDGIQTDVTKTKIKKVSVNIPLDKIGHADKEWFFWSGDAHKEIIAEAVKTDKLGIEEWNINAIIVNANISDLNSWLNTCPVDVFDSFVNEIKSTTTSNEAKAILPKIKLFKFGTERKSREEIDADTSYVISTAKTTNIKAILEKVGMKCTDVTIESHPLSSLLTAQNEKDLFANIKAVIENKADTLYASEKLELVIALRSFEGIGDDSIKELNIFKNRMGKLCSLGRLVAYTDHPESWQLPYVICNGENFSELQKYLISNGNMFAEIVSGSFAEIINDTYTLKDLYNRHKESWKPENTDALIKEYGATEETLWLIEQTKDKSSVEEYIKCIDTLPLSSSQEYSVTCKEYRCIQIAAKVEAVSLRNKITIDGIKLTEFSSSDLISFKCKNKEGKDICYSIKLSDVLPEDTQCALYGKVASKFSLINGYDKIFSADSSNQGNVTRQLQSILEKEGTVVAPAQYLYILLTRYQYQYSSLSGWDKIIRFNKENESPAKTIVGILDYAYNNELTEVLIEYKTIWLWRQHTQHKYLLSKDYTLEEERAYSEIEDWCSVSESESKKAFLKQLDMHFNDSAEIKRRIAFRNNTMSEWDVELNSTPTSFLTWVNSIRPVTGENQKKLLLSLCLHRKVSSNYLKQSYDETDYCGAIELSSPKYLGWRKADGIRIYTLQSEMPYRVLFSNEDVLCHDKGEEYHYFKDTKHLYVKGTEESEIAASLAKVYSVREIPFSYEDYIAVCFNSLEEQREKDEELKKYKVYFEEIKKKEQENEERKEDYRREYSEKVKEFMGSDFSMPSDKIKSEHIISRYRTLIFIKGLIGKFKLKHNFDEKAFIRTEGYAPIPLEDGKHINVQGVKFGIWHLSPMIWKDIVDKGNYACLCIGNGEYDFKLIENENDIKEIAESTKNVFMRLTPTESMDIMSTIKSVYDANKIVLDDNIILETVYTNRDVHLMLKVHPTSDPVLNSMFDNAFKAEYQGGFDINDY